MTRTFVPASNLEHYGEGPEHQFFEGSLPQPAPLRYDPQPALPKPKGQSGAASTLQKALGIYAGVSGLGKLAQTFGQIGQNMGYDNAFTQGLEKYGGMASNPGKSLIDYWRGEGQFGPDYSDFASGKAGDDALSDLGINDESYAAGPHDLGGSDLLGAAGDAYGLYGGIKQGGLEGYGKAAQSGYGLAQNLGWLDSGVAGGAAESGAGGSSGGGLMGLIGLKQGIDSLGKKEGKAAGTMSGAKSGMAVAGPWGALVGGILGYAAEGGTQDAVPWDAAGFSGETMDEARKNQDIARLASNPGGAIASSLGVKSDSTLGKVLDPASMFHTHGDEKRNLTAFMKAFPGVSNDGPHKDSFTMPDGKKVTGEQLQQLAGAWYGATYHPDGDQTGWQTKFDDRLKGIYGAARGGKVRYADGGYFSLGPQPPQLWPVEQATQEFAQGGSPFSPLSAGLSDTPRYVEGGPGGGRGDLIDAKLSPKEYVMDAETVALAGDGDPDEGARKLDKLRERLRIHKGKNLAKGKFSLKAKPLHKYLRAK